MGVPPLQQRALFFQKIHQHGVGKAFTLTGTTGDLSLTSQVGSAQLTVGRLEIPGFESSDWRPVPYSLVRHLRSVLSIRASAGHEVEEQCFVGNLLFTPSRWVRLIRLGPVGL